MAQQKILTTFDWKLIPKVICVLETFAVVTAMVSGRVGPSVKYLIHEVNSVNFSGIGTLWAGRQDQLQKYFLRGDSREHFRNIEKNELFAITTLLDPRYKSSGFIQ